jgi:P27 family predicted phage terminase small subunit
LTGAARREFRRLAKLLDGAGVLPQGDRAGLALIAQAWARWCEAEEKLAEKGAVVKSPSGFAQVNPWLSVSNKAHELLVKLCAEYGLTPASRPRLRAAPAAEQPTAGKARFFRAG